MLAVPLLTHVLLVAANGGGGAASLEQWKDEVDQWKSLTSQVAVMSQFSLLFYLHSMGNLGRGNKQS